MEIPGEITSSHGITSAQQQVSIAGAVIIRGSGSGYVVVKWTTAIATALFLLGAAKGAHQRDTGMVATWLVGAALFAVMFIKTVTVRVVLSGDEILYGGLF